MSVTRFDGIALRLKTNELASQVLGLGPSLAGEMRLQQPAPWLREAPTLVWRNLPHSIAFAVWVLRGGLSTWRVAIRAFTASIPEILKFFGEPTAGAGGRGRPAVRRRVHPLDHS